MSHKYRIGNNLEIQWTVNLHRSDGTLVDLTSLNLGVQLIVGQKLYEVQNPTIAANLITFLYPGVDQHYDGPYVVKLYDKDNTAITYDARNAFILTDSSWTADSAYVPEDITVEIETDINTVQIVAIAGPKGDKGDKGDTGAKGDPGKDGADGANGYDGVDGKDGADGKDGQDGRNGADGKDGEPGRSIRKSVFEVGKMYYNGKVLSDDGVYYLDIVTDTAVAMADEEVNYYVCKETHLSTANEDLDDTTLWTHMSEMDPIVTPLLLADTIDAKYIKAEDLEAGAVRTGNNLMSTLISGGSFVIKYNGVKRAEFGVQGGDIVLVFYDSSGFPVYNLGPSGIVQNVSEVQPSWSPMSFQNDNAIPNAAYTVGGAWTVPSSSTTKTIYRYNAGYKKVGNVIKYYNPSTSDYDLDSPPEQNGKWFTQQNTDTAYYITANSEYHEMPSTGHFADLDDYGYDIYGYVKTYSVPSAGVLSDRALVWFGWYATSGGGASDLNPLGKDVHTVQID